MEPALVVSPTSMFEHNWLEPIDRRIKQVQKEIEDIKKETAALAALHRTYAENGDAMKNLADLEAWEAYCEASLDLSNQDDVGEDAPWLDGKNPSSHCRL